jgi:hypothetical protein
MSIELPKKLAKQEITDFSITWNNNLTPVYYDGKCVACASIETRTIDGSFKLKNGRTIHIHEDLPPLSLLDI